MRMRGCWGMNYYKAAINQILKEPVFILMFSLLGIILFNYLPVQVEILYVIVVCFILKFKMR